MWLPTIMMWDTLTLFRLQEHSLDIYIGHTQCIRKIRLDWGFFFFGHKQTRHLLARIGYAWLHVNGNISGIFIHISHVSSLV